MSLSRGRRAVPRGRLTGVAGMVVAAGLVAACGGAGTETGAGASPGPAGAGSGTAASPGPTSAGSGPTGAATAGPCEAARASQGGAGSRQPTLPRPGSVVVGSQLFGVSVPSAASVWAVGTTDSTDPEAMHWNGRTWTEQSLPLTPGQPGNPPGGFQAVAAVSPTDVWAVGVNTGQPLAERWQSRAWTVVPTPAPSGASVFLQGVAAVSARDIWAVGGTDQPVILHWDGGAWTRVPGPALAGASSDLYGVAAVSAVSAWAVGDIRPAGGTQAPLIEHWNGTAWTAVPSPGDPRRGNPGGRGRRLVR